MPSEKIIPALGHHWLTALYDPVLKWTTREDAFKGKLLDNMRLAPGQNVLDVGCGTGTLALSIRRKLQGGEVIGLDADPQALQIAEGKARRSSLAIRFERGSATALYFDDASFDHVVSSLMFHHLAPRAKRQALAEMLRVLRPGGLLHVADWGRPANPLMRFLFVGVQLLDGFATTADSVADCLPTYAREAGFSDFSECHRFSTVFGTLALYQGCKRHTSGPCAD